MLSVVQFKTPTKGLDLTTQTIGQTPSVCLNSHMLSPQPERGPVT